MLFTLVLLLASGCLSVICFILADDLDYAENRVSDLRSDYYDLENDMESLMEQAEFFDEYVVFVETIWSITTNMAASCGRDRVSWR